MTLTLHIFSAERTLTNSGKNKSKSPRFVNSVEPEFDPIAAALKQMHDGVAKEPVPDEFLKLLDQLDERLAEKDAKPS
jgi:hypothetical protein